MVKRLKKNNFALKKVIFGGTLIFICVFQFVFKPNPIYIMISIFWLVKKYEEMQDSENK